MRKINIFTPVCPTGYGVHGCNLVNELEGFNTEVSLHPIGQPQMDFATLFPGVIAGLKRAEKPDFNLPAIKIWHDNDMAFPGSIRIGYTVFELDKVSDIGIAHLETCNEIWVVSKWAKDTLSKQTQRHITVIPEGVNNKLFTYNETQDPIRSRLRLLNIGKLELRKGHLLLIKTLAESGIAIDLFIAWHNPFLPSDTLYKLLLGSGFQHEGPKLLEGINYNTYFRDGLRIFSINGPQPNQEFIKHLCSIVDAGIFPYSAEGWNLPLIECMATGLPCIATNYSGPTEYLTKDNCILLEPGPLVSAKDGIWFHGQGNWASIEQDKLIEAVKSINNQKLIEIRNNLKGFGEEWSWQKAAQQLQNRLVQLEI